MTDIEKGDTWEYDAKMCKQEEGNIVLNEQEKEKRKKKNKKTTQAVHHSRPVTIATWLHNTRASSNQLWPSG